MATCSNADEEARAGCYYFIAYYPVLRDTWVRNIDPDGQNHPGMDPANADRWLLVEYRCRFPGTSAPTLAQLQARLTEGSCSSGEVCRAKRAACCWTTCSPP
ncbi:hypothetical protein [Deinococcus multiflagellatus]|uniref:Uncharacterized protein n=1 Tax=Deinococcus multiflagellatus TaxID=1656887 RepID=A0ABW1ZJA4_9DEIO